MRGLLVTALLLGCPGPDRKPSIGSVSTPATETVTEPGDAVPILVPPTDSSELALPQGARARLGGTRFRHDGNVTVMALSSDGRFLATGASDNAVIVWDAATGAQLYAPERSGFLDRATSVVFVGDAVVIAGGNSPISIVSTKEWTEQGTLATCGKEWVMGVAVAPDGKTLAVACEHAVFLQPFAGGTATQLTKTRKPDHITWSADGAWIAYESDGLAYVEIATRKVTKKATSYIHGLAFSPRGAVLAYDDTKSYPSKLRLLDVASGKEIDAFDLHVSAEAIAFSHDGAQLAYAQATGPRSIVLVDLVTKKRRDLFHPTRTMVSLAFTRDGKQLWLAHDHAARLWDLAGDREVSGPAGHFNGVTALSYSPDGKTLASGSSDSTIRLWDLAAKTSRVLEVHTDEWGINFIEKDADYMKSPLGAITGLQFAKDGKRLYETDGYLGSGKFRAWDVAAGTQLFAKGVQSIGTRGSAFVDGKLAIVLGVEDGLNQTLVWHDLDTLKRVRRDENVVDEGLAISRDGTRIAVTEGETVRVLETTNGKEIARVPGSQIESLAFSPDGSQLALGALSGVKVYKIGSKKPMFEHQISTESMMVFAASLAFAPDGRMIVGSSYGDVEVVTLDPKVDAISLAGHGAREDVLAIAVAPDGMSFATGGEGGEILIWPL